VAPGGVSRSELRVTKGLPGFAFRGSPLATRWVW